MTKRLQVHMLALLVQEQVKVLLEQEQGQVKVLQDLVPLERVQG